MDKLMCDSNIESSSILDSLNTAIIIINSTLNIHYANHSGLALFATGYKQMQHQRLNDFIQQDVIDSFPLQSAIDDGEDFTENQVRLIFKDHRQVLVDLTVTNIELDNLPFLMFEIKVIEKQQQISRANLQNAQHFAARELVRGLAHEIKNPLGGIRGAAQLLEKELAEEQKEYTQLIMEQSDRLRNLVDRLLGPNSKPNMVTNNVHQAIEQVRTLTRAQYGDKIQIIRDYDPSIPSVFVDNDMIQQAILNIVRNSIQALTSSETDSPCIRLVTRIDRQVVIYKEHYPLVAKIKIIDNGPGIPSKIQDTLFYPMVTTKENGSGLGLSIAQTLINHHNGKIEVESRPGHTEFVIYLPIEKKESSL
jgi:two-component system nitrogen regulation sensor histidine kinase GlnL